MKDGSSVLECFFHWETFLPEAGELRMNGVTKYLSCNVFCVKR